MNNYNQSSTGHSVSVDAYYSNNRQEFLFDSEFKILRHSSRGECGILLWYADIDGRLAGDEKEAAMRFYPARKPRTKQEYIDFLGDFDEDFYCHPESITLDELKAAYDDLDFSVRERTVILRHRGLLKAHKGFTVHRITGFSQGDVCYIYGRAGKTEKEERRIEELLQNMVYRSPLVVRIDYNGEEYYLDECAFFDEYEHYYDHAELYSELIEPHAEEIGLPPPALAALAEMMENSKRDIDYCY